MTATAYPRLTVWRKRGDLSKRDDLWSSACWEASAEETSVRWRADTKAWARQRGAELVATKASPERVSIYLKMAAAILGTEELAKVREAIGLECVPAGPAPASRQMAPRLRSQLRAGLGIV